MDMKQNDVEFDIIYRDKPFGKEAVQRCLDDLKVYVSGKASVDQKATANQLWWQLRHWQVIAGESNEGVRAGVSVGSAWAVNSLLNKHADIMDSFPKPNILPREMDDEMEAKLLTDVVPTILEQNDYEQVYRSLAWDICIDGCSITSVLWDNSKHDGLGDVSIQNVDVHNLFWQPGVQDIQDSDKVFYVSLQDINAVRAAWPKIADKIGPDDEGLVTQYQHDDNIDTSNLVTVVEMYYKKSVLDPVEMNGVVIHNVPKTILHYAVIIGSELAFCSENEQGYENGFYEHGQYPFVIRRLFPVKDSPWGFGYLDIIKNTQKDIDKLDQAVMKNALLRAKPRYWARKNANIDLDDFADASREIVEVGAGELGDAVRKIDVDDVPSGAFSHLANKIEELKETSGNRDFNQGGVSSGVTAAASIAALQEAGSKLSRDINKELYRGCREEYYLVIELIRQFYTEPRSFRVDTGTGDYRFILFSNAGIVKEDVMLPDGTMRHKSPVFDIQVTAEKQSPFSRAAQNETIKELYGMGLFQPENAIPALVTIDAMDFEGKDKIRQQVEQNAVMLQQFQAAMQMIQQLSLADPRIAQMAMQQGLLSPEEMADAAMGQEEAQQAQLAGQPQRGTPEDRANSTGLSYADKIRKRSAEAANPS